eukprot:Skav209124  [mRNA]  locus=scaffold682:45485:46357:- [translate_table: standard]
MATNQLTYKKVYVNSAYRLPQSNSSSDFVIELDQNFEVPDGSRLYVTEVSLPTVWKTTEVGFFEKFYAMVYDNTDTLLRCVIIDLSNKVYFAEQLSFDIVSKLNDAVRDLNANNDIFVYAYSSATRTVEIKVADGLNFKLKIPTDDELKTYVDLTWNRGDADYNNTVPLSINYLLSNYVATNGGIATWTSSYLNLVPFRALYLNSPELTDHHYNSPANYSSSIIRKILIDQQLGGVVNDAHSGAMSEDYINIGNRNLKRLSFRLTDENSKTINLYNIPLEFSLLFSHPSY